LSFGCAQELGKRSVKSMALLLTSLWATLIGASALAHEIQPGIADLRIEPEGIEIELLVNVETRFAGIDATIYTDSNEAPEAEEYDRLRALSPQALTELTEDRWREIADGLIVTGIGPLELVNVEVPLEALAELARESRLTLRAPLLDGTEVVQFGWAESFGPLVVRQVRPDGVFAVLLRGGEVTPDLPVGGVFKESAGDAFSRFVVEGFEHIVPKGLDHILFVLGLFFFALAWSPLLWQVTAFTVAHSVTLALATLGVVTIPDNWMWLVEALIALSITYVALENILRPQLGWWRPAVVFAFGLLHGLGFASVLGDLGLAPGQFALSLLAFNIGVEIGQLAVILAAFLVLVLAVQVAKFARLENAEIWVQEQPVMYRAMSLVGSILIAIVGAYWFIERAFL